MPFMDISKGGAYPAVRNTLFVWSVNIVSWTVLQKGIEFIFSTSNSKLSYGIICGWWGALYLGLLLRAYSLLSALISAIFSLILLVCLMLLGVPLIPVHDLSGEIWHIVMYAFVHSIVISSPIMVNTFLVNSPFLRKCRERGR